MLNYSYLFFCFLIFEIFATRQSNYFRLFFAVANKVDLNQVENNYGTEKWNKFPRNKSESIYNQHNAFFGKKYNKINFYTNETLKSNIYENTTKLNTLEKENVLIDSNGNISSLNKYPHDFETRKDGFLNISDLPELKISEQNNSINLHNSNNSFQPTEKDEINGEVIKNNQNKSEENLRTMYNENNFKMEDIENSYDVLCLDFSIIYNDLLSEPNLKTNVEYTIFNISDKEKMNKIDKELRISNDVKKVVNLNDLSSYGFISWIKPIESNSNETTLQFRSGIIENRKIDMFKDLFPRRNFTNEELDIFIMSELRNESRPYGYKGSPVILTEFIENVDFDNMRDIFSIRETIEILNQTNYTSVSQKKIQEFQKTKNEISENLQKFENSANDFKNWLNSFLLHDDPNILSINCDFYNQWSSWSACTNECGWGIQTRGRRVDANKAFAAGRVFDKEHTEKLKKCKVQIQTQGCNSKAGCCEYSLPKEDLWKNCTATCENIGIEEQTVELISNQKSKVKDISCKKKKLIKRKCLPLVGEKCKACDTSEWSSWSSCNNENGDFIKKRSRTLNEESCSGNMPVLQEIRICDYLPSTTQFSSLKNKTSDLVKLNSEIPIENIENKTGIFKIEECTFLKSKTKFNILKGTCECPDGINFCESGNDFENEDSSWKFQSNEICNVGIDDPVLNKNKNLLAIGKKIFDCRTKKWQTYQNNLGDSDCAESYTLCKIENECIVSNWSKWSGCSAPCKTLYTNTNSSINPVIGTRYKTRKVIKGNCNEHSLIKREECPGLMECPQQEIRFSIGIPHKEFINSIFKENNKNLLKQTLLNLPKPEEYKDSLSNIIKDLIEDFKNIIIKNSQFLLEMKLTSNFFGEGENYYGETFIHSLLSEYDFDNIELVSEIISRVYLNSKVNQELYTQLTTHDKKIIGNEYSETVKFIEKLFPSKNIKEIHLNKEYFSSNVKNENKGTRDNKIQIFGNKLNVERILNEATIPNYEPNGFNIHSKKINYSGKLENTKISHQNKKNKIQRQNLNNHSLKELLSNKTIDNETNKITNRTNNTLFLNGTNEIFSKNENILSQVLNPGVLYKLIEYAVISRAKCKPIEIVYNNETSKSECKCPTGYSLCSSIDYYFGNKIFSIEEEDEVAINIRDPLGVFADNFVLNKGGLFEAVYERDKKKYCERQGAKVMCSSKSEVLKSLESYDIINLYANYVHFD